MILVGRTGLDAALRLDPALELVRVRTPLEAIGELATPIDSDSPSNALVVLAPDVVASLQTNGAGNGSTRLNEFTSAIRQLDSRARIVGVGVKAAAGTDGTLPADVSSVDLRSSIRGLFAPISGRNEATNGKVHGIETTRSGPILQPSSAVAQPPQARTAANHDLELAPPDPSLDPRVSDSAAAGPQSDPTPDPLSRGGLADAGLVEIMLRGKDVLAGAISLLRARTKDQSIQFTPSGPQSRAEGGVPVEWNGVVHGRLTSDRTDEADLVPHARWLAAWLRLRDQQSQLREAAFTDSLTGAWNRRYFDRFLSGAIEAARNNRWSVTVMVFDIDNFKQYNDEYGHEAGDEILRETVQLLRSVIRPSDRVCRIGGDEFAVIFHEPQGPRKPDSRHPQSVFDLTQRFQEQIAIKRFPKLGPGAPGTLTVSGGLATFPWDGASAAALLARADELAMVSKRQGKNAITFGPGSMRAG